jgi:PhnB protein
MAGKAKPIPDGYYSATPYLIIKDATRALEFYKKAFGATELMRMPGPDGRLLHAEIKIGNSPIMLADDMPEMARMGTRNPQALGDSSVMIALYVDDVDAVASQAVAAGAKLLIPVKDQFYGDRSGRLLDPFGHVWIIATHTEDVPSQEMEKRFEDWKKNERPG